MRLIDDAYGLVVDAVLGPGVRLAEAGGPCARALATLKRLSIPLVSLDVPSGTPPRGSLVTLACFFHPSQILPSAPLLTVRQDGTMDQDNVAAAVLETKMTLLSCQKYILHSSILKGSLLQTSMWRKVRSQ